MRLLLICLLSFSFASVHGMQMTGEKITTKHGSITFSELMAISQNQNSISQNQKIYLNWLLGLTVGQALVIGYLVYDQVYGRQTVKNKRKATAA